MIKKLKLFKKKPKAPYTGEKAEEAYLEIEKYMQDKTGKMECPKPSSGLFRDDSYDWTVYRFYEINSQMVFSHRHHVQHEGDCIKYLEEKIV